MNKLKKTDEDHFAILRKIGENSKVSIIGGTLKNVGVGIVSKDGSDTVGRKY